MTEETKKPNAERKLFFGLFIFPLVIAVGMALILCSVVLVTSEKETAETLISGIKSGSESKRWQKAFELSNELNRGAKSGVRTNAVMKEIIYILGDANEYDVKTRSYMAIALSHFRDPAAIEALKKSLENDSDEVRLYALHSLGVLADKKSASAVASFLKSENPELRKIAVYVLGVVGSVSDVPRVKLALNDAVADVRWNAALTLARLGDASGFEVLTKMLDRKVLASEAVMNENEIERAMTNAVKGLALIQKPESITILKSVSKEEQNMRVRQAAMDALEYIGKK